MYRRADEPTFQHTSPQMFCQPMAYHQRDGIVMSSTRPNCNVRADIHASMLWFAILVDINLDTSVNRSKCDSRFYANINYIKSLYNTSCLFIRYFTEIVWMVNGNVSHIARLKDMETHWSGNSPLFSLHHFKDEFRNIYIYIWYGHWCFSSQTINGSLRIYL